MITIDGIDKNLGNDVFLGWRLESTEILKDKYIFIFAKKYTKEKVWVGLSRILQYTSLPALADKRYQCNICDVDGVWESTHWITFDDIKDKSEFFQLIERTIDDHTLPF